MKGLRLPFLSGQMIKRCAYVGLTGLAACGGGGGGGGYGGPDVSLSAIPSTTAVSSNQLSQGRISSNPSTDYGRATVTFEGAGNADPSTQIITRWDNSHLADTSAPAAWAEGWTGLGSTISVIDDFSTQTGFYEYFDGVRREGYDGAGIYDIDYRVETMRTHGDLIASIAGGHAASSALSFSEYWRAINGNEVSCDRNGCRINPQTELSEYAQLEAIPMAGVAKEANIIRNHVDLSSEQSIVDMLTSIQAHVDNSRDVDAINLSIGFYIDTNEYSFSDIATSVLDTQIIQYPSDAVIVTALGNSGAACTQTNLAGCNALAVAVSVLPELKHNTIFAGALSGSGSRQTIAPYSTRPGIFRHRSLLAQGDMGFLYNDQNNLIQGTSFAAPRIAGAAAILRQKFPTLTGQQAAHILLLTADKDINNDGIDDFTGASALFGQGKLDLLSALSPVGTLAVK